MSGENPDRDGSQGRRRDQGDRDGQSGQDGQSDRGDRGDREARDRDGRSEGNGEERPSTTEKVVTAVSIAFTVLVFGFVAWQAVQPPTTGAPRAETVGVQTGPDGSALVHVRIANPGDAGLLTATVEANCSQPPPEVMFENVPAGGQEEGVLVCPAGTTDPNVSVSSWIPV